MRALLLATLIACASAAPSGDVVEVAILKTAEPGDLQAAEIDAKVKAEDALIQAADRARDLKEQTIEAKKDELNQATDIAKEQGEEAFWSIQDKRWQAVDALKTAEAQIDGSVASYAEGLARAYGVVLPYAGLPIAPPLLNNVAPFVPNLAPVAPKLAPVAPKLATVAPVLAKIGTLPGAAVSPLAPVSPIIYAGPALLHADKLKLLKEEKAMLEKKIEYLEMEKKKFEMFEKENFEMLEKLKIEMEKTRIEMEKRKEMVKTAELEKGENKSAILGKKANLEKNLSEKPAVLLYNALPQPWNQPLYVQGW